MAAETINFDLTGPTGRDAIVPDYFADFGVMPS